MKLIRYIEVRVNGRVSVDAPLKITPAGYYAQVEKVLDKYSKKGLEPTEETDEYAVLVDYDSKKAVCVSWKEHFGVSDANGERIYNGSQLRKVIPEGEPQPEYNDWYVSYSIEENKLYLSEYIGDSIRTGKTYEYENHPVESFEIFKSFTVC